MLRSPPFAWIALMIVAASSAGCGEDLKPLASPIDVPAADGYAAMNDAAPDAPVANDDGSPARDAARDVASPDDAAPAFDAPPADSPAPDAPRDAAVADAPIDTAPADAARDATPPADAPACVGAAPVVAVTAPTANEAIETCTASGAPVYYDFTAAVASSAPLLSVTAQWRTPRGDLAPPPPPARTAPPFVFRRQVGGMMTDAPPLGVLSDALRGTWQFEVTAVDACGRTATTRQPFTLTYTSRRCPNP